MKNNKFFETAEAVMKSSKSFEEAMKKVLVMAENMTPAEKVEFVEAFRLVVKMSK